jgi:hypothetical protein
MKTKPQLTELKELAEKLGLDLRLDSPRLEGLGADVELTDRIIKEARVAGGYGRAAI